MHAQGVQQQYVDLNMRCSRPCQCLIFIHWPLSVIEWIYSDRGATLFIQLVIISLADKSSCKIQRRQWSEIATGFAVTSWIQKLKSMMRKRLITETFISLYEALLTDETVLPHRSLGPKVML